MIIALRHAAPGQKIYVIDSGLRADHNEFIGRVLPGWGYRGDTRPCNGHGTHVAGTALGSTVGVATQAQVVPVKVLDCYGMGRVSWLLEGIDWILANNSGPAIANLSLSVGAGSEIVDQAIASLAAAGVAPVVAAGNSGRDACLESPARAPEALAVGATDRNDQRASFSNWGGRALITGLRGLILPQR